MSKILDLFADDEKQQAILNKLKEKPYQESQYRNKVLNSGLDPKEATQEINKIEAYKKEGLIIDDIPPTWKEHQENTQQHTQKHTRTQMLFLALSYA